MVVGSLPTRGKKGHQHCLYIEMDEELQEVTFTAKESESTRVIDSEVYEMEQNQFYTVSILGNEKDPYIYNIDIVVW